MLPGIFRPVAGIPLVRVGRGIDGGYLIDRRNLDHADLLIGMGVSDDWSFEEDFLAARDVPLISYDGSVSAWDLFIALYKRIVLFEPANARAAWRHLRRFQRFYKPGNRRHHDEFVGDGNFRRKVSLETILARDVPASARRIFFSVDIEMGEYDILDALVACAGRIEGLVIEFHDVDRNMRRISEFLDRFALTLAHVHVNNHPGVLEDGTPLVVECSFTRHPADPDAAVELEFPHPLDQPNVPGRPEVAIRFAGDR